MYCDLSASLLVSASHSKALDWFLGSGFSTPGLSWTQRNVSLLDDSPMSMSSGSLTYDLFIWPGVL